MTRDNERTTRRDAFGMGLGIAIAALFGGGAYAVAGLGGWWLAAAVPLAVVALFGMVGFGESVQSRPRDDRGIRSK